jgi:hypothetical protein
MELEVGRFGDSGIRSFRIEFTVPFYLRTVVCKYEHHANERT